jgi:hypothetical protein
MERHQSGDDPSRDSASRSEPDYQKREGEAAAWQEFNRRWTSPVRSYLRWLRCTPQQLDELTMDALVDSYAALNGAPAVEEVGEVVHQVTREASAHHKRRMREELREVALKESISTSLRTRQRPSMATSALPGWIGRCPNYQRHRGSWSRGISREFPIARSRRNWDTPSTASGRCG